MNVEGQIKGIERNAPRAVSDEITAWEILNLRHVRGGLRPVGRKPVEITDITGTALHVHVMDTTHNLISIDGQNLYFKNLEIGTTKQIIEIEGELFDVNHLGRILIVSTTARKYEFIYDWDNKEYDLFPDWTDIQVSIRWRTAEITLTVPEGGTLDAMTSLMLSEYRKYHLEQRMAGKTEGRMFVRYAVELSDGTYIWPSRPIEILLFPGNEALLIARSIQRDNPYGATGGLFWKTGVSWVIVQFPADLGNILSNYRNIIAGVAIFGTTPRSLFGEELVASSTGAYHRELPLSNNTAEKLIETEPFNLWRRFDTDEIIRIIDAGNNQIDLFPNYETLDSQEKLILDDEKLHKTYHATSLIYNERLLTGNISTRLFDGWDLFGVAESTSTWPDIVVCEFEIETAFGIKKVQRRRPFERQGWLWMVGLISYPDIRATRVNIYTKFNSVYFYLITSKKLKPHPTQNFAYCFLVGDVATPQSQYGTVGLNFPYADWDDAILLPPLPVESSTFTDPNRVQASETGNALVMPYKNSYQVGNSSILGLAANGEPTSEGQFGQYPIYVFTGEGIYMMDVGVDPFISSIRQINGEVCNSPKTIRNIGIGVLFTTDKGLMVINGRQVNSLSADFEQEVHNDYAVRHNPLYQKAVGLTELGKPDRFVSTVPFMDYLIGANIGYDYPNREIWVNNPEYPYSYVYSIDSQMWSKRDETFITIVDDYPRYYAQQGSTCKNLSAKEGVGNINIFLLSNPVKIRLDEFKQFRRIVARGEFPVERMGMYLFGSIDGFSWAYTGGKEIVAPNSNTIIKAKDAIYLGAHRSAKYAAVVIEGVVTHEWNLTHISETAEPVTNKKLR